MPMKSDLFVDSAGWGCFLDKKHPLYAQTDNIITQARKLRRRMVTSNYVVTELVPLAGARLHLPHQMIVDFVNYLYSEPSIEVIHIDRAQHDAAWKMYEQHKDKEWSLVDTSSFILMTERGIKEALTTDKHFVQARFIRLPLGQREVT